MSLFPNYKARVSRAVRNNVPTQSALDTFKRFKVFTLGLMLIFPIYPSLAALGQISDTQAGDYDPTSIIFEYTDSADVNTGDISQSGIVKVDLDSVGTGHESGSEIQLPAESEENNPDKNPPASNVKTYTVVENDDIFKIAKKNKVDPEIVLWTNNIAIEDTLEVGQILKIPSITGVIHTLGSHETISDIARKYNVSSAEIMKANAIEDPTKIRDGRRLLVPGATPIIEEPKPVPVAEKPVAPQKKAPTATKPAATIVPKPSSKPAITTKARANGLKDRYLVRFTGLGRGFYQ